MTTSLHYTHSVRQIGNVFARIRSDGTTTYTSDQRYATAAEARASAKLAEAELPEAELPESEPLTLDERIKAQIARNEAQIAEDIAWLKSRGWTDEEIEQGQRNPVPSDAELESLWQDARATDEAQGANRAIYGDNWRFA